MSDLADFLLARISEDEAVARPFRNELGDVRPWRCDETGGMIRNGPNPFGDPDDVAKASTHLAAEHIARHDPGRVLAECAAKRRLVELHHPREEVTGYVGGQPVREWQCPTCVYIYDDETRSGERIRDLQHDPAPCDSLLALAQPYAGHPHFHPSWAET